MSRFVWNTDWETGQLEVDTQHKQFISIINALLDAVDAGKGEAKIEDCLRDLRSYARIHFRDEEAFMSGINFPGLEEHRWEHEKLQAQVEGDLDSLLAGNPSARDVLLFLRIWLVNHILGWDLKMVKYAKETKR